MPLRGLHTGAELRPHSTRLKNHEPNVPFREHLLRHTFPEFFQGIRRNHPPNFSTVAATAAATDFLEVTSSSSLRIFGELSGR